MNSVKVKEFMMKIISGDLNSLESHWYNLSDTEKNVISKQIKEMPPQRIEEIKKNIKIVNEYVAYEIFEQTALTIKVEDVEYSLEELKLKCLEDIHFVSKIFIYLYSLEEKNVNKIFDKLKEIDPPFCNSLIAGYDKLKSNKSMENFNKNIETYDKEFAPNKQEYLEFLKDKTELLNEYFKMLKESKISLFQIKKLMEIESENINNYYGF